MEKENFSNDSLNLKFTGIYKFQKSLDFEGKTISEVPYDLTALKGMDVHSCKRMAEKMQGSPGESLVTDDLLHVILFARAADLPAEAVKYLSAADYTAWSIVGQVFLVSSLPNLTG